MQDQILTPPRLLPTRGDDTYIHLPKMRKSGKRFAKEFNRLVGHPLADLADLAALTALG